MASSESVRPLPPPTPPPPRTEQAVIEGRRSLSGFTTADSVATRLDTAEARPSEAPPSAEAFRPGSFAPESAIDEQIADLERWALANLQRDRRNKVRFWVLRGIAFLGAAAAAALVSLGWLRVSMGLAALAALCVAIDAAWPSDSFRNVHQRAVYDLRELQNLLKLRWDKVRLAHQDPAAPQRTAHALALLDHVQSKREEIGKYLGSAEASPGVRR
ncbi:MAG TPA: hypothetical protein VGI10_24255 [Polyangiaceae bacterium]|jgi:hypothetical protein